MDKEILRVRVLKKDNLKIQSLKRQFNEHNKDDKMT